MASCDAWRLMVLGDYAWEESGQAFYLAPHVEGPELAQRAEAVGQPVRVRVFSSLHRDA